MQYQTFFGKMALMAGAYQYVLVFIVIECATEMGAFARDGPEFALCSKENKLRSNKKFSRDKPLCDFNPQWFSGDMETNEA